MIRLRLIFCYDGSPFSGFQRQKNTKLTVQEALEETISMVANSRVSLMASGRTDAGVHARVQVAHVNVPAALERMLGPSTTPGAEPGDTRLKHALNRLLPPEIRIFDVAKVSPEFHALRDVEKKTYLYFIHPSPGVQWPELKNYAWHLRLPLDWKAMEEATVFLKGRHDFKSLCAADTTAKTTVRTLFEARWGEVEWRGIGGTAHLMALRVTGSGFLKNMVRSIVGTLVYIGNGKAPPTLMPELLATPDRSKAGPTAPPHGLWLWDIKYPI